MLLKALLTCGCHGSFVFTRPVFIFLIAVFELSFFHIETYTPIDTLLVYEIGLTLALLGTISVALVLGRERPRFWSRAKEHLGDLHPIIAIRTCKECFYGKKGKDEVKSGRISRREQLPRSFLPRKAGARSLILPGRCSRIPIGMYLY